SELDGVKGIGPETKKRLLTHFKSIKRIKEASKEEIVEIIGNNRGSIIAEWIEEGKNKLI
ncbi:MAG TPA: hypothetical protein DDX07_13125, partial [Porphyromonadaceae bacterium]|nr:hypothetical protein [Porphyromonadaceae bacterium]